MIRRDRSPWPGIKKKQGDLPVFPVTLYGPVDGSAVVDGNFEKFLRTLLIFKAPMSFSDDKDNHNAVIERQDCPVLPGTVRGDRGVFVPSQFPDAELRILFPSEIVQGDANPPGIFGRSLCALRERCTAYTSATGPDRFEAQKVGSAGYRADEPDRVVRVLYVHPAPVAIEEPTALDTPFQLPGETPAGPQQAATPSAPRGIAGVAGAPAIAALSSSFRK